MKALLILNLIVPFVMILVGIILKAYPVADIGSHNGYNTPTSRKSQAHWDFAQRTAPGIFIHFGMILVIIEFVFTLVCLFINLNIDAAVIIGNVIGFVFLIKAFLKTERMIKES